MNRNVFIIISVVLGGYFLFNTMMPKPASKVQNSPAKQEDVIVAGIPVEDERVPEVIVEVPKKIKKISNVLIQNNELQELSETEPEPTFEPRSENSIMMM